MKKSLYCTVLLLLLTSWSLTAQLKLKGNKEVTIENRAITEFTKIEVIDNVNVFLVYNENQSVNVETDSNLQDAIVTEVSNGILTVKKRGKIVRKKKLEVQIKVNRQLKEISAYNNVNLKSKNSLNIDSLTLNAFDNADFNLKLNSKLIRINGKKTSDIKLEALCDETFIRAEESCEIKATIDSKDVNINILDKSSVTLSGSSNTLEIASFSNGSFKGKNFESDDAIINATHTADVYVNALETIEIFAKNSAEVYIYSNPEIIISEFFDKASIHKKQLDKKLF